MKKILVSAFVCSPYAGTEPGNGWNWALHLAERGMTVRVLAEQYSQPAIEDYCQKNPGLTIKFTFFKAGPNRLSKNSGIRYFMWQWKAVAELRKLLSKETYDVIHHVTFGSIHVPSLLWRSNIPVVFGPVGGGQTAPNALLEYFGQSRAQWQERIRTLLTRALPYSPLHRRWLRKMKVVLATNRETQDLCQSLGRPDARLSFDTALPDWFYANSPKTYVDASEPLRLLWVGRLLPRKAIPLTLDILARVSADSTLTIIGYGIKEATLRGMIHERGLDQRVIWKPERIPWTEVREAYRSHDALLFTSLRDSCAAQLLEAMAMGLPIITLALHGGRDLVPETAGIKVPVDTKEQVIADAAAAVDQFSSLSSEARTEMSRAAWTFAKTLTWKNRAAFAEDLYDQILSGRI